MLGKGFLFSTVKENISSVNEDSYVFKKLLLSLAKMNNPFKYFCGLFTAVSSHIACYSRWVDNTKQIRTFRSLKECLARFGKSAVEKNPI